MALFKTYYLLPISLILFNQVHWSLCGSSINRLGFRSQELVKFLQLYDDIFKEENFIVENEDQLRDWILEANQLASSEQINFSAQHNQARSQIEELARTSTTNCDVFTLSEMLRMEFRYAGYQHLHNYIEHCNNVRVEKCLQELENQISHIKTNLIPLERIDDLLKLIRLILGQPEYSSLELIEFTKTKEFAQALLAQLQSLGFNDEMPLDRSLRYHIELYKNAIRANYYEICELTIDRLKLTKLKVDQLLKYGIEESRFSDDLKVALYYVTICHSLVYDNEYLYPLARFDFIELKLRIFQELNVFANEQDHEPELIEPDQMVQLLDSAMFSGQAELAVLNLDHSPYTKQIIEFITVSQISESKCELNYIREVGYSMELNVQYPNVIRFLKHFGHLQMRVCLAPFESKLKSIVSLMSTDELDEINKLRICMKTARANSTTQQVNTRGSTQILDNLYDPLAAELTANGLDLYIDLLDNQQDREGPSDASSSITASTSRSQSLEIYSPIRLRRERENAIKIVPMCHELIGSLHSTWLYFRHLKKLDSSRQSAFSPETLRMMANYNVCRSILELFA